MEVFEKNLIHIRKKRYMYSYILKILLCKCSFFLFIYLIKSSYINNVHLIVITNGIKFHKVSKNNKTFIVHYDGFTLMFIIKLFFLSSPSNKYIYIYLN